jgi:protein disulfide-isomerase
MRLSLLLPLLSLVSPLLAAPADTAAAAVEDAEATPLPTKFNGEEVPPLRELSGQAISEEIKQGYW